MKLLNIFVTALLLIGAAGAVVELSGTDPAVFDQPGMVKDGLRTQIAAEVWGTPIGWNNVADGTPYGDKTPLLTGSLAKDAYLSGPAYKDLPSTAAQVDEYLNGTLNRSADLTIIDDLNVTNLTAEA